MWKEAGGGDSPSGTFNGPDAVVSGVLAVIQANFDEYHPARPLTLGRVDVIVGSLVWVGSG